MNVYINSVTVEGSLIAGNSGLVIGRDNSASVTYNMSVGSQKNDLLLDLLEATLNDESLNAEEKVKFFQIAFKSRKQQFIETEEQKQ